MVFKAKIQVFYGVLFCFTYTLSQQKNIQKTIIEHQIQVIHPGIDVTTPIVQKLYEVAINGAANVFYTDVESVVCGSKVCKIFPVRLFWDHLGRYQYYTLSKGIDLEKEEGVAFTKEDHTKMHSILQDEASVLKDYYKEELVDKADDNAYDALSGATIAINPNAVVEGAIWTCYTLWHWANGTIVNSIRTITAKKCSNYLLQKQLIYADKYDRILAIETLMTRKVYDDDIVKSILKATAIAPKLQSKTLAYLEKSSPKIYYKNIVPFFEFSDEKYRITILNSLSKTTFKGSYQFYNDFAKQLAKTNNYQEISLILDLFQEKNQTSDSIVREIIPLLEHQEFLIARSAFWFLNNVNLTASQRTKLSYFQKQFKSKL